MEGEPKTVYVCEGTGGEVLSEEEYANHETKTCQTDGCSHFGKPFVKKEAKEGLQDLGAGPQ